MNNCLIKIVQRCSPCGVLLLIKVYSTCVTWRTVMCGACSVDVQSTTHGL